MIAEKQPHKAAYKGWIWSGDVDSIIDDPYPYSLCAFVGCLSVRFAEQWRVWKHRLKILRKSAQGGFPPLGPVRSRIEKEMKNK